MHLGAGGSLSRTRRMTNKRSTKRPREIEVIAVTFTCSEKHVSRQSPNSSRRKGTVKGPRGIQARDRREVCGQILHHEFGRENCQGISLRGMGTDRAEVECGLGLQSFEEEVLGYYELLRSGRRDGWAGQALDARPASGSSRDQGRSGGGWESALPGSQEHGSLQSATVGEPLHG